MSKLYFYVVLFCFQFNIGNTKKNRKVQGASQSQKRGDRKVQRVPQSQTADLPRHQEEEETDNQTNANRTNVRKAPRLALSSPSEVIAMRKGHKKAQEQTNTQNKSPHRINHKATKSKTGTTALERSEK